MRTATAGDGSVACSEVIIRQTAHDTPHIAHDYSHIARDRLRIACEHSGTRGRVENADGLLRIAIIGAEHWHVACRERRVRN